MQQGILTGKEILRGLREGVITIDPFNEVHVNPASFDLTLGKQVKIYKQACTYSPNGQVEDGRNIVKASKQYELDSKNPTSWETYDFEISEKGWLLRPGICYLMHTAERVTTDSYVPVLDGKSSVGRMFVKVHETAGYGDAGFNGQYTLEVTSQFPVRVYAGMRFCQIRFHTMRGEPLLYQEGGHYKGPEAQGAVATKVYEQWRPE